MKLTVPAEDFGQALVACAAHTTKGADDGWSRTVDIQTGDTPELIVTGSGGSTSGVARVPLVDWNGEMVRFALDRSDVATVTGLFHDKHRELELTVTDAKHHPPGEEKPEIIQQITVRELGALFGGNQLKISVPDYRKRDVGGIWHTIASSLRRPPMKLDRTAFHPGEVALFKAAARAYKSALTIETADGFGSLLVFCGDQFVGFLHADSRTDEHFIQNRDHWRDTLPIQIKMATGS